MERPENYGKVGSILSPHCFYVPLQFMCCYLARYYVENSRCAWRRKRRYMLTKLGGGGGENRSESVIFSVVNIHHNSSGRRMWSVFRILLSLKILHLIGIKPLAVKTSSGDETKTDSKLVSKLAENRVLDQINCSCEHSLKMEMLLKKSLQNVEPVEHADINQPWVVLAQVIDRVSFFVHIFVWGYVLSVLRG